LGSSYEQDAAFSYTESLTVIYMLEAIAGIAVDWYDYSITAKVTCRYAYCSVSDMIKSEWHTTILHTGATFLADVSDFVNTEQTSRLRFR